MPITAIAPDAPHDPGAVDPRAARKDLALAVALSLAVFVVYVLPAPWRPLNETAEARIAVVAREMLRSGDWLLPQLGERSRLQKPPLPYWLVALSASLLGAGEGGGQVTEVAAVLPSAVLGALCVFLVTVFAAQAFGRAAGFWAGLWLGSSALFLRYAQLGTGEIALTFFTACAFLAAARLISSPRPGLATALGIGVPLGLAILTKGHIPILLIGGGLAVEAVRRRRFHARKTLLCGLALLVALLIAAPWYLAVLQRYPSALQEWFGEVRGPGHVQSDRWIFYLYQFPVALLPCGLFLLLAFPAALGRWRQDPQWVNGVDGPPAMVRFLLGATAFGFLAFYLFPKQQPYYLLPLIPPLAVAGGAAMGRLERPGGKAEERTAWMVLVLGGLLGAALALVPLEPRVFPGLQDLPLPAWEWSLPLGLLAVILALVSAREWTEGHALGAGICCGVMVLAIQLSWTLQGSLQARQRDALARESGRLQNELQWLSAQGPVFAVGFTRPLPVLLYYLDCKQVLGLEELLEASVDAEGRMRTPPPGARPKPGVVLCTREGLRELGMPAGEYELQLVPLADYQTEGAAFLPLRVKRKQL